MPVRPPRRIFRTSVPVRAARTVLRLGVAAGIGGALWMGARAALVAWPAPMPAPSAETPARLSADAGDVTVLDGDTLRLHDRVVRLFGIATPARGTACGPQSRDCAAAAADALATLVRAERVDCAPRDTDGMGRPLANCAAGGTDLAHALVAGGWARVVYAVPDLTALEAQARTAHRGFWASADRLTW